MDSMASLNFLGAFANLFISELPRESKSVNFYFALERRYSNLSHNEKWTFWCASSTANQAPDY
jgi:hypothetical protein